MAESALENVAVVLCRAEGAMNVGAVCRAMKTMGLTRLVLAACPSLDETTVRTHALAAMDVYEEAERYDDLAEALAGFSLAGGFTRRTGRRRKESVAVADFAGGIAARPQGSVALVFGNERDGLSDAELRLCDEAVCIDSSSAFPSLNLSHAVQIAVWEVRKAFLARPAAARSSSPTRLPAPREAVDDSAIAIVEALRGAGFFKLAGRQDAEDFVRSVATRAALSSQELERFRSLFIKLAAVETSKSGSA